MGLFAHATHLFVPDKELAKNVAGALLRSPHSLVIATPYDHWMNVYLPMGISYKDVPELPTRSHLELNCYDSQGFDLRYYTADRLAFLFESGCGDVTEEEDRLFEIAEKLWRDDPNRPQEKAINDAQAASAEDEETASHVKNKQPDFWDQPKNVQDDYVKRARESKEYKAFVANATESDDVVPEISRLESLVPVGRSLDELELLLSACARRLFGPPSDEKEGLAIEKWMKGKRHSERAEDYLEAISSFFNLRGSLWSLENIMEKNADKVDRRIIKIDELENRPA